MPSENQSIRDLLRRALTEAMRARDRAAVSAYRQTMAAIDNAEAVPIDVMARAGAVEAAVGLGAAEAARRTLTEDEIRAIVATEIDELRRAAAELAATCPDHAAARVEDAERLSALLSPAARD